MLQSTVNKLVFASLAKTMRRIFSWVEKQKVYDKIRSDIHVWAWTTEKNGLNGICYENHRQFDGFHLRILREFPGNNDKDWVRMVLGIFPIPLAHNRISWQKLLQIMSRQMLLTINLSENIIAVRSTLPKCRWKFLMQCLNDIAYIHAKSNVLRKSRNKN